MFQMNRILHSLVGVVRKYLKGFNSKDIGKWDTGEYYKGINVGKQLCHGTPVTCIH